MYLARFNEHQKTKEAEFILRLSELKIHLGLGDAWAKQNAFDDLYAKFLEK